MAQIEQLVISKQCRGCQESLPLSAFGINSVNINAGARDGLNIQCKVCVRQKIAISRRQLKEYKAARIQPATSMNASTAMSPRRIAKLLRNLDPVDRVLEAIRGGADTQDEIAKVTRLPKDDICNHIAELLLDRLDIGTREREGNRLYFVRGPGSFPLRKPMVLSAKREREIPSHGISTIYFTG